MVLTQEFHRKQAIGKLGCLHRQRTGVVDHHGATIKHQLVLPAHQVGVHNAHSVIRRLAFQQRLAPGLFVDIVGRGIQVQDQLRTGGCGIFQRAVFPDVFTHGDANRHTLYIHNQSIAAFSEVASFIEHLVIGRATLEIPAADFAFLDNHRGVIQQAAGAHRRADYHGRFQVGLLQTLQGLGNAQVQARPQ